ncbi:MAG: glycosyltransferase family 2 protein [Acutalibacteraceae bacterium]|nr:glycosyltransferase family 2 protein [Acutalibacteraceae bacterium]
MDISLIIPCFNEEGNVELFFEETEKVFSNTGYTYEYVFVNDGSSDSTKQKLKGLFENNPQSNITVVNFSRNFGKESAIYAGLKNVCGDNICIIDADLQQRPEVALKMYERLKSNPQIDCVCAFQKERKEGKILSVLKSCFYKIINKMSEIEFKNGASDFRFFKSKVKDAMLQLGECHRFSKGIFSWVGFNVDYMEYEVRERNSGSSKWSPVKLFKYAFSGIIAFSIAPLRFATLIGSCSTVFSIIYAIVTIIRKLTSNINVDGFTQLALLITFFSGIMLFTIGIIGEYIARIYQQVKNRPIYIVDEIIKRDNDLKD